MVIHLNETRHGMGRIIPFKRRGKAQRYTAAVNHSRNDYVGCNHCAECRVKSDLPRFFISEDRQRNSQKVKTDKNIGLHCKE